MIKNIIFDWSGTLSNDLIPVYTATMRVFRKLGLKKLTLEKYRKEFICPYMRFYHKFKCDANKEEVDELFIQEINLVDGPKPFPRSREVLEFLKQRGINIALLSSHPQKKLEKEIKNYSFQRFFVDINGGVHDKVNIILEIMRRNGFEPEKTAYVGDMTHDIDAGKKARVTTIAVSWGYQTKEKLSKENPNFLINDLEELKAIIEAS